ncbi:MAG: BatD family protein [Ignavibacteria bacterium]|nr:BatD family protein [Ignavibacteria bacterium]
MKTIYKILFIITLLISKQILAQDFTASVSSNKVGLDDRFEITFTISGQDVNAISNFQAPSFNDFYVLSGPNQSTSMQIINGAISASRSFTYYLQPKKLGQFTIGSASITYQGKVLKSNSLTIDVVQGQSRPKTQSKDETINMQDISSNLFIRASVDKTTAYKGEQITVTYKLYTRLNISSPQVSKLPEYKGFWAEELDSPSNIMFNQEVVDGKTFNVGVLKKAALFATETGELSLTPFELKIPVLIQRKRRTGDPFEDFFNDPFFNRPETYEYVAKSNQVKVKILPLPPTQESSFNGVVGNFTMEVNPKSAKVKQNEAITLKISINGNGNLKLIESPEIKIPQGFEKYDPKVSESINRSGVISGKKNFEYLIIPRNFGKYEIQPIRWTYFNPQKRDYVTLTSQPIALEIEKGSGDFVSTTPTLSKEEIKLLEQDIHFIKTKFDDLHPKGELLIFKPIFTILSIVPFLAFISLLIWKKREQKLTSNLQLLRNMRAEKISRSRLKLAQKFLKENQTDKFYEEVSRALFSYIENKLNIPKAELNLENVLMALRQNAVNESEIETLKSVIEKCEFIRFAPSIDAKADMQNLFNQASQIIIKLEENLSK